MNGLFDIPELKIGDVITADFLNRLRKAAKRTSLRPGQFWSQSLDLNEETGFPNQGGGEPPSMALGLSQGAIDKDGGSVGPFVYLNDDLVPVTSEGEILILDPEDPEYDSDTVDANTFHCKCAQQWAGIPTNARIQVWKGSDAADGTDDHPLLAKCIDVVDYLFTLAGFDGMKALAVPEDGVKPEDITWLGKTCDTPPP